MSTAGASWRYASGRWSCGGSAAVNRDACPAIGHQPEKARRGGPVSRPVDHRTPYRACRGGCRNGPAPGGTQIRRSLLGVIYLLHFERSYHHARHYLGYTDDLEGRLAAHRAGRGSPLVAAAVRDGIDFVLAATWPGDRHQERRLHRYHNSPRQLCPICRADPGTDPDALTTIESTAGRTTKRRGRRLRAPGGGRSLPRLAALTGCIGGRDNGPHPAGPDPEVQRWPSTDGP